LLERAKRERRRRYKEGRASVRERESVYEAGERGRERERERERDRERERKREGETV